MIEFIAAAITTVAAAISLTFIIAVAVEALGERL
jgi:hypothetical protein